MPINLKKELDSGKQVILLIMPNEEYTKDIIDITKQLGDQHTSMCYVSLNKLYDALMKTLKDNKININKFFFIDCITKTATTPPEVKNAIFMEAPNALTTLSLAIKEVLKVQKPDVFLFDSLSTLLIYERGTVVTKFVHSIIGNIRKTSCKALFTCLKGDTDSQLVKDLGMFVDKVIDLGKDIQNKK